MEVKALLVGSRKGARWRIIIGNGDGNAKCQEEVKVAYFMGWGRWIMSYE